MIEVGALRGSLLSSPVLQNLALRDIQGDMVGHIEEVRLTHNLTSLVRGRLMGHAIEIVRPQFRIVRVGSVAAHDMAAPATRPSRTRQQGGAARARL